MLRDLILTTGCQEQAWFLFLVLLSLPLPLITANLLPNFVLPLPPRLLCRFPHSSLPACTRGHDAIWRPGHPST
ncbi:MAG: hypothetical protein QME75_13590 [Deltaproteobacteria bacterium]|nr:hypothetical protein [Deltaproteobacteria bacterium]